MGLPQALGIITLGSQPQWRTGYAKAYPSAFATTKGSQLAVAIETLYDNCDLYQAGKVHEQTWLDERG